MSYLSKLLAMLSKYRKVPAPDIGRSNADDNLDAIETTVASHLAEDATQAHLPKNVGLGNVDNTSDLDKPVSTATQNALDGKVNNSQVLTNVPAGAKFTDTITTINSKTGAITKDDIVALGIPAQDTVVDISGKADKTYVDDKVKTDVPVDAKFTDTVYTHPASHPASMITGLPESLPASGGDADTVGGFTVGVNVPAGAKFTDTVYVHPTTAGNKHIPTGGSANQILKYSASGTAVWEAENDTITTINGKTGAVSKEDIVALGIPAADTDTTYTEITTAEIDAGTASTLRTITARRLKYLLDKIVALFPTKVSQLTNDSGFLTSVTKSDVGLSNVTNDKQMPISGGVLENYREKLVTLSGTSTAINLSLGNVFIHTLSGNTTYTISNAVSGQAHSFTLIIYQPITPVTLTFPVSVKWQGGEIPDLSGVSKIYVLTFMTVDGGTTWLGMFGGDF